MDGVIKTGLAGTELDQASGSVLPGKIFGRSLDQHSFRSPRLPDM